MSMALDFFWWNSLVEIPTAVELFELDGCGYLWLTHFKKGGADGYRCLGVDEDGAVLCFGCLGHDIAHDFAHDE